MKVFLSLCLLFSLVSPAVLRTCTYCENGEKTECTKNRTKSCRYSEPSCKSVVVNGDLFRTLPRAKYSCSDCEAGYYALNTGSSGSYNMFCCGSDNCNAQPLEIPSETMEPNGRECSGCYVEDERECSGTEVVKCLGDQTKCMKIMIYFLDMHSLNDSQYISARGCATPEMCEKFQVFENMLTTKSFPTHHTIECGDAV